MTRTRAIRLVLALLSGAALACAGASQNESASASAPHRAAVVVDLGDGQVRVGCVSFTEDHLSGLEALDRASMAPVAQTFGGQGSAVCAICGKGCTAGSTCLTCKAPNYWAYYHDGVYSPVAASSTQVRDGDTEGWKWGKGERPAAVPFDKVCPPTPPSTRPNPTTQPPATVPSPAKPTIPAPGNGSSGSPGQSGTGVISNPSVGSSGPTSTVVSSTTAAVPTVPTTSAPARAATTRPDSPARNAAAADANKRSGDKERSSSIGPKPVVVERGAADTRTVASGTDRRRGGTSVASVVGFAAALVVVAGLIVVFRRRRTGIG